MAGKEDQGKQQGGQGSHQGSQSSHQGTQGTQGGQSTQGMQGSQGTQKFTDPVCGMSIGQNESVGTSSYQGQTYHFCSQECKQEFDRSPQQFAKRTA